MTGAGQAARWRTARAAWSAGTLDILSRGAWDLNYEGAAVSGPAVSARAAPLQKMFRADDRRTTGAPRGARAPGGDPPERATRHQGDPPGNPSPQDAHAGHPGRQRARGTAGFCLSTGQRRFSVVSARRPPRYPEHPARRPDGGRGPPNTHQAQAGPRGQPGRGAGGGNATSTQRTGAQQI